MESAESAGRTSASRRHTIANRPRKKKEEEEKPPDFSRPKLSPPEVMAESLYSTVDKQRRYPAPDIPAPPPPYEGAGMKKTPPPEQGGGVLEKPEERSTSPPGYEAVMSPSIGAAPSKQVTTAKGPPAGPRLPPGRPSRPPAGIS